MIFRQQDPHHFKRWQFLTYFDIPDIDRPDVTYLTRYRIIQTPYGSIYVHKILLPDGRVEPHDHPWTFLSIILRGGYSEYRINPNTRVVNRFHHEWVNLIHRDDAHYISVLDRVPTWTLCFVGRKRRTWGYWTDLGNGEWAWTHYNAKHQDKVTL